MKETVVLGSLAIVARGQIGVAFSSVQTAVLTRGYALQKSGDIIVPLGLSLRHLISIE